MISHARPRNCPGMSTERAHHLRPPHEGQAPLGHSCAETVSVFDLVSASERTSVEDACQGGLPGRAAAAPGVSREAPAAPRGPTLLQKALLAPISGSGPQIWYHERIFATLRPSDDQQRSAEGLPRNEHRARVPSTPPPSKHQGTSPRACLALSGVERGRQGRGGERQWELVRETAREVRCGERSTSLEVRDRAGTPPCLWARLSQAPCPGPT
jgi:hypothetical protein